MKYHRPNGWLKQQKCIFSQFWRLGVWDHGVSECTSWSEGSSWLRAGFLLCPHMEDRLLVSFPLLIKASYQTGALLLWFCLTFITPGRPVREVKQSRSLIWWGRGRTCVEVILDSCLWKAVLKTPWKSSFLKQCSSTLDGAWLESLKSVLLTSKIRAVLDSELDITGCSPSWFGEVLKVVKSILLFQSDFYSGLKNTGCIWPRAACLDMNLDLAVNTPLKVSRFSPPVPAQGWPNVASKQSLKWSLLHFPCLDFSVTFAQSWPARNHLKFFLYQWLG